MEQKAGGLNWKLLIALFAIVAIDTTGLGVVVPLLPFYSEHFGATPFVIGVLLASYSLSQFVASPWIGRLSDRIGRKPVLLGSQIGTFVSFILLASAPNLALIFVARIIDGLTSGNISVVSAVAVDASTPATRRQAIGVISAAIGVGMIFGPALSGLFAEYSISAPIWVATTLSAGSILTTAMFLPSKPGSGTLGALAQLKTKQRVTKLLNARSLSVLSILLLFYFAFSMFMTQFPLFLSARFLWRGQPFDAHSVGLVFTAIGAVNIFVQLVLMKRVGDRVSDRTMAATSFTLLAFGYALMGMTRGALTLGVAVVIATFGMAFLRPTLISALSGTARSEEQGALMGVNSSLMAGAGVIAPIVAGYLINQHLYVIWAAVIAGFAGVGSVATLFILKETPTSKPARPAANFVIKTQSQLT